MKMPSLKSLVKKKRSAARVRQDDEDKRDRARDGDHYHTVRANENIRRQEFWLRK